MNNKQILARINFLLGGVTPEGYPLAFNQSEGFGNLTAFAKGLLSQYNNNEINIVGFIAQLENQIKATAKNKHTYKSLAKLFDAEIELSEQITKEEDRISYKYSTERCGMGFNEGYYSTKLRGLDNKHDTVQKRIASAMSLFDHGEWDNLVLDYVHTWYWDLDFIESF